ncbi:MAG TPA: thiamine-phosphate kinase [Thermoanaerobaculia bacterium]|nr:thiamine-phosphate kinase [Thermoanaerobaculia bacterium]
MTEDELLAWLRTLPDTDLLGDDTARLPALPGSVWIATTDSQVAGVHVPADLDPAVLARRLLAVNLSDLAAAAAEPAYALAAVSAPAGFGHRRFLEALLAACAAAGVRLAGGDLARSPVTTVTLTLLGTRPEGSPAVGRGNARPGDLLWVGGTLGDSGAGQRLVARGARLHGAGPPGDSEDRVSLPEDLDLPEPVREAARRAVRRHLAPRPQLELGAWLGGRERAAALDLSDGLARDLPRLARESGAGAEVDAEALPLADGFGALSAALGEDPLELALGGGEDYVLLFALPSDELPPDRFGCKPVGRVTEETEPWLVTSGRRERWPDLGWDHLG